VSEGHLEPLTDDEDARQYRLAIEMLGSSGYVQYEVSNFAQSGYRSHHNWGYWTGAEYLGVGLSAHSYAAGVRSWNLKNLTDYLERVGSGLSPKAGEEQLDAVTERREAVWLGLRTCDGIEVSEDERLVLVEDSRFRVLVRDALIHMVDRRLMLTSAGFPLADALGTEILAMLEKDEIECETGRRDRAGVIG
jgi:oxygen-independent coproporphyrinogen-3 oxidase